jgi:hypothetical protein
MTKYNEKTKKLNRDLISQIASSPRNASAIDKLLQNLNAGEEVDVLLLLINSNSNEVSEIGTWIASEIGARSVSIMENLVLLLSSPNSNIVFNILDCLTSCSNSTSAKNLVLGLEKLASKHGNLVWKAQMFLWSLSDESVLSALEYMIAHDQQLNHLRGLKLIYQTHKGIPHLLISEALQSTDQIFQAYAVVCAALISSQNIEPMRLAIRSENPVVKEFAESAIRIGLVQYSDD